LSFEFGTLFACLKCLFEVVIFAVTFAVTFTVTFTVTTRTPRCAPAPPLGVLIVRGLLPSWTTSNHAVAHIRAATAFLAETGLILEEICDILCLLADVSALVLAVLVEKLEFLERLNEIDVVAEVDDDVLRASMETVVEQRERLQESRIRALESCGGT